MKKIVIASLIVVLVIAFGGCGSTRHSDSQKERVIISGSLTCDQSFSLARDATAKVQVYEDDTKDNDPPKLIAERAVYSPSQFPIAYSVPFVPVDDRVYTMEARIEQGGGSPLKTAKPVPIEPKTVENFEILVEPAK